MDGIVKYFTKIKKTIKDNMDNLKFKDLAKSKI